MNLWDNWKLLTDDQVENFCYFFENDLGIALATKKQTYDIIRGVRILSTRGQVGWISENLIEILSNKP